MAYKIVKNYVASSRYRLKCPYKMTPKYITVHNTANDASARNEVSYMRRNSNATGFHAAVDDKEVVIGIPYNRNSWHAGDGNGSGNRKSIGIEICYSKSGGSRFTESEKNAAKYIASLLKSYGWGISRVKRHYDWNGKRCPHRTMDRGWTRFLNMVETYMKGGSVSTTTATTKKTSTKVSKITVDGLWGVSTTRATQKVLKVKVDGKITGQSKSCKKYLENALTASWQFTNGKGSSTIKALQKLVGSKADGVAGKNTVTAMQKFLNKKGYNCGAADGYMGTKTVKAWQKYINAKL